MSRLALIFALTLVFISPFASADIPHLISLQGKLTDASDNPISSSTNFVFRIYPSETGGTALWTEFQTLSPDILGIFSALLGSVTALNIPFNESYWLEVKVNSEILSPRTRMGSAGYALRAENPWNATGNNIYTTNSGNVGIGTSSPAQKLDVAGKIKIGNDAIAPSAGTIRWTGTSFEGYNGTAWISFAGSGGGGGDGAPLGTIAMWAGTLATIPSGWQLCDGTSSTPDLTTRFVRGVASGVNPGATGGSASHNHIVDIPPTQTGKNSTELNWANHDLVAAWFAGTEHTHTVDPAPTSTTASSNIPPYYEVAFICKVSAGGGAGVWTETASSIYSTNTGKNIGIGTASPGAKLTVAGMIESTSGGFKFPDGTTQASKGLTNSDKNIANGIAGLDTNGKILSAQMPNNIIYQYDALYGRTGTASGWTTTPSSLSELTDGNTNNFATAGTVTGLADGSGYITYDLGSSMLINSIDWNFAGTLAQTGAGPQGVWSYEELSIETSTDGITYTKLVTVTSLNTVRSQDFETGGVQAVNGLLRYVRIKCYAGSSQPGSYPSTCTLYGKRIRAATSG